MQIHQTNFRRIIFSVVLALAIPVAATAQQEKPKEPKLTPVPAELVDGKVIAKLVPANSRVDFTGVHAEGEPRPRIGGFKKFSGKLHLENNNLKGVEVEFEIGSIWTEFDNLTKHLMNEDFFETDKFPKAKFSSSSVTNLGDGNFIVVGELTLHGESSKIEFPAKFSRIENGVTLTSEFVLDRTDYGMDKMTGGVKKEVDIRVVVGQATPKLESSDGNGGEENEDKDKKAKDETAEGMSVTIQLPNMTWSGCEASVRSALKSVDSIQSFETSLNAKTATITFDKGFDLKSKLNELSESNGKIKDWSEQE